MTTELTYLLLTAVLAASMWMPFIIGVTTQTVVVANDFTRPPDLTKFPAWIHRSHRAHLNLVEQMMPFAVVVLIAHVLGISTSATVGAAAAFFFIRVAHAVGMISGWAIFPIRPIIFTAGWLCILVFAWQILAYG